jgi:plastocyanin
VSVAAGAISIRLVNEAPVPHNVTIAEGNRTLASTRTVQATTTTARANLRPGRYAFFCSVAGHRQAGMEGVLTVR